MKKSELKHARKIKDDSNRKANLKKPHKDLIPVFLHYNPETIITKNGELLQIIKITGFNNEFTSSESINLREIVRNTILERIDSSNFAIWLHTIRRKKNILPKGKYRDYVPMLINNVWNENNDWSNQYINELYMTVIISGKDAFKQNVQSFFRSMSSKASNKFHLNQIEKNYQKLNEVVENILLDMEDFGVERLSIFKKDNAYYSRQLSFFSKIVNFVNDKYKLKVNPFDEDLTDCKIAFGNRELEVIHDADDNFGAIFSVKEYNEISIESLDKFLQLPQEFIISQSLNFTNRQLALSKINYQNYILEVSQDEEIKYLSGLSDEILNDNHKETDFSEQQITITLINKSNNGLKRDIESALKTLQKLGLVVIREDLYLEHCFWSQIPGNFKMLSRKNVVNSSKFAGFASLHNFPAGSMESNHWGSAVSIFRTAAGTPYFFNFHHKDKGHTIIVGPASSGKKQMMNFLVAESCKFNNKLFYFNSHPESEIFIRSLSGSYLYLSKNSKNPGSLKINPLKLSDSKENREFLTNWFNYLINYGENIPKEEKIHIKTVIEQIFKNKINKLSEAAKLFQDLAPNIYKKLAIWHSKGQYSFIFDHEEENNLKQNLINCFSLTNFLDKKGLLIPIFSYLLHKIELSLDGKPTMIVLDRSMDIINNYAIAPLLDDFLERISKKNCIVIFSIDSDQVISDSYIKNIFSKNITTSIFSPDKNPKDHYMEIFGLDRSEFNIISQLPDSNQYFLLKHHDISVISDIDLNKLGKLQLLLSANIENRKLMQEIILKNGSDPKKWVPEFLDMFE